MRPSAERPARGKGRPQKGGSVVARDVLIATARTLLKVKPPAEINRLDVARMAGLDPALIRYYFGTKDQLLHETAVSMIAELRARRGSAQKDEASIRGKLAAQVRFLIDTLYEYPFLHDLLVENIRLAGAAGNKALRSNFVQEPLREVSAMIEQAVASGEIRPVNPIFFYVAMIGMCSFPMRNRALLEQALEVASVTPANAAEYAEFVAGLLLDGLAVRTQRPKAKAPYTKS